MGGRGAPGLGGGEGGLTDDFLAAFVKGAFAGLVEEVLEVVSAVVF